MADNKPRRPKWVQEYLDRQAHEQIPVEEQITLISVAPPASTQQPQQAPPQAQPQMPQQPGAQQQNYHAMPISAEFTGYGDDGRLQRDMPTEVIDSHQGPAMVHEGELKIAMSDGVTVVIPAHEFDQTTMVRLESAPAGDTAVEMPGGERKMVDLNTVGQGILAKIQEYRGKGPEPMEGMATGGAVRQKAPGVQTYDSPTIQVAPQPNAITTRGGLVGSQTGEDNPDKQQTLTTTDYSNTEEKTTKQADGSTKTAGGMAIAPITTPLIKPQPAVNVTGETTQRNDDGGVATSGGIATYTPIQPKIAPGPAPIQTSGDLTGSDGKQVEDGTRFTTGELVTKPDIPTPMIDPNSPIGRDIAREGMNQYERGIDQGYQYITDTMLGENDLRRNVMDRRMNEYNASAAAASRANLQRLSNAPGMTEGARRMAAMTGERNIDIGAAQLAGQLADSQLAAQDTAARDAITYGQQIPEHEQRMEMNEQSMEMNEIRMEDSRQRLADQEWARALEVYDPKTPEGLRALQSLWIEKFGSINGQPPDMNFLINKRDQDLEAMEQSRLQTESMRQNLNNAEWTRALSVYDARDPEGLRTLQDKYVELFGGPAPDLQYIVDQQETLARERELAGTEPPGTRITELFAGRTSKANMLQDPILRSGVAARLDVDENDPAVDAEIEREWQAYVSNPENQEKFGGNAAFFISEHERLGHGVEAAQNDPEARWNTALHLGYDPASMTTEQERNVEAWIADNWSALTTPAVQQQYEWLAEEGYLPPEFYDAENRESRNPFLKSDMQEQLRALPESAFDEEGNLVNTGAIEYPWTNPNKVMNYVDFNGNPIEYTENGEIPEGYYDQEVALEGNGTDFFITNEAGERRPITFRDAKKKWENLSYDKRMKYVDAEGNFDAAKFYNDSKIWDKPANPDDPESPAPGTFNGFIDLLNSESAEADALNDKLSVLANGDLETGKTQYIGKGQYYPNGNRSLEMQEIDPEDEYVYYDENGVPNRGVIGDNRFNFIAYQLSNVFNDGEIMTPSEFARKYDTIKWRVDDEGNILNFDPEKQKVWGINPDTNNPSSYRVSSTFRDALPVSDNDTFIPSEHENYLTRKAAEWLQTPSNQVMREHDGWRWKFTGKFGSDKNDIGNADKNWFEIYDATNDRYLKIPSDELNTGGSIEAWKIKEYAERQGGGMVGQEPLPQDRVETIKVAAGSAIPSSKDNTFIHSGHQDYLTRSGAEWVQKAENQRMRNHDGWLWKFTGNFASNKDGDTIHPYKNWVEVYDITNDATWRIPTRYLNSSGNLDSNTVEKAINKLISEAQSGHNMDEFSKSDDTYYGVGGANNLSHYIGGTVRGNQAAIDAAAASSEPDPDAEAEKQEKEDLRAALEEVEGNN